MTGAIGSLPAGWTRATLADVVPEDGVFADGDWVETKDQDPEGDVRLVQLADVGDGTYRDRSARFLTSRKAAELRCTFLQRGDVLVARMPDPLGRACVFPGDAKRSVTAVDVCIIRPGRSGPDARWLCWFLNAPQVRAQIAALQAGTTRKRISRKNLATVLINVPPRDEQERIVAEIEKQFTRLDAGVEALRRLQAHLRRYRAAVLKAACEGRLAPTEASLAKAERRDFESGATLVARIVQERRRLHELSGSKRRYAEPMDPQEPGVELPEGWARATVAQLSCLVDYGSSSRTSEEPGVPVLRMGNIIDGVLDLSDLKYLPPNHEKFPALLLQDGDVLFNRTNSPELVGKTAVYRGRPSPCSFASYLIRVRLIDGYLPYLLAAFINSTYGREWIRSVVVQQVGQANVNGSKLQALAVPVPPRAEQKRIVEALEEALSDMAAAEGTVERALGRAARLRASVLRSAFEGRLVPAEPPQPATVA